MSQCLRRDCKWSRLEIFQTCWFRKVRERRHRGRPEELIYLRPTLRLPLSRILGTSCRSLAELCPQSLCLHGRSHRTTLAPPDDRGFAWDPEVVIARTSGKRERGQVNKISPPCLLLIPARDQIIKTQSGKIHCSLPALSLYSLSLALLSQLLTPLSPLLLTSLSTPSEPSPPRFFYSHPDVLPPKFPQSKG